MTSSLRHEQSSAAHSAPHGPANWPLRVGGLLVGFIVLLALIGPWIAPHDPLERFSVLKIGGVWTGPPFPAFTPGFVLGTDGTGRDLLSRLLWGVRPTLIMVTIIATARLLLGLLIGTAAGWSRGWPAPLLDGLITGALLVPVLVVALAVIAFVGIQRGLLAFILGLTLTGWAESARYVETQTRALRALPFVEAARTAGAGDGVLIVNHVLRHILPQSGMLFATEMSATLMVTAGLGFLGYFIGGGVWVTVTDFAARNEAANPELGQLLATSLERILQPWPMIVVGGAVVLIILGFNLLGDGLRRRLDESHGRRPTAIENALGWLAERLVTPASQRGGATSPARAGRPWRVAIPVGAVVLVAAVGLWMLWPMNAEPPVATGGLFELTGHLWSAERHDRSGTLTIRASGPLSPTVAWSYAHTAGFSGGPVIAADGTIYLAATDPALIALTPEGTLRWSAPLAAAPVGAPALDAGGRIYVVDTDRGLSAFSPDGAELWRTVVPDGPRPSSGPIVGVDGRIYFAQAARVRALDAEGGVLWLTQAGNNPSDQPPRLAPDGAQLFLLDMAFAASDGAALPPPSAAGEEFVVPLPGYVVGADEGVYFVQGTTATRMDFTSGVPVSTASVTYDTGALNIYLPSDAGFTADHIFWIFYGNAYIRARLLYVDVNGRALANIEAPFAGGRVLGMDGSDRAYLCSDRGAPLCLAVDVQHDTPLWQMIMPGGADLVGGALGDHLLYVATKDGVLHALRDPAATDAQGRATDC